MEKGRDSGFIRDVRESVDLPRVVADYVTLKKAGRRRFKALCPFHSEKTPSFVVDGEKQLFYCFGCGVGGDTIRFVMLQERMEFMEAVRWIATRNGIPIPAAGGHTARRERVFFEANEAACAFFRRQLAAGAGEGRKAREYLASRRLEPFTIERFEIGFAPNRWDALKQHLLREGFQEKDLCSVGLLGRKEETRRTYDRFRGRIMFPIRNLSGKCVGFGGRILGEGVPKYLNSPESPVFDKGRTLYGLPAARPSIRAASAVILVEGYLDFLTLFQAGVEWVVATLGTAFGAGHARPLRRFADRVIVNFDPDAAGSAATHRSLGILLEQGFDVRILRLPGGDDPDRFLLREGVEVYRERLEKAPAYLVDLIQEAAGRHRGEGTAGSLAVLREVLPFVARLESPVARLAYAGPLAETLGLEEDSVLQELREALKVRRPALREEFTESLLGAKEVECRLLQILLGDPDRRSGILRALEDDDFGGSPARGILAVIRDVDRSGGEVSYGEVHRRLSREEERQFLARVASSPQPAPTDQEASGCLQAVQRRRWSHEMKLVQRELETGSDRVEELLKRKMELGRRIEELNRNRPPAPAGAGIQAGI